MLNLSGKKIWVAGEAGLVGQGLLRALEPKGCTILHAPHDALDLTDPAATREWLEKSRPDGVFLAAAKVGGIRANNEFPADFIRDNLAIAQNVIHGCYVTGVSKLLFLGSSCIYPKMAAQPIAEDSLLTGPLEPTNEWYAIAKIAGLKMCQAYRRQHGCNCIAAMPTNLYGPHDRFDKETSHVIPAMMDKFHAARLQGASQVDVWGTGTPLREFLYVDDLAHALIVMMERYDGEGPVNIGSGEEVSIRDLAILMANVTGFTGNIRFDHSKPDGTPRKYLDSTKIRAMGWLPKTPLMQGLEQMYRWYTGDDLNQQNRFSASSGT